MNQEFGALPPPNFAWQIGKTAASISFVNSALRYITTCSDVAATDRLQKAIQEIKEGKQELDQWLTPEEFLARKG